VPSMLVLQLTFVVTGYVGHMRPVDAARPPPARQSSASGSSSDSQESGAIIATDVTCP
jgi:hypothetical protein